MVEKKENYTISEVAEMFDLSEWTIRLWCNRFDVLQSSPDGSGERLFTQENVDKVRRICCMTRKKRMTLARVKKHLEEVGKPGVVGRFDGGDCEGCLERRDGGLSE